MAGPLWKQIGGSYKIRQMTGEPATPLLGVFPKEVKAGTARAAGQGHRSIIHNSQNMKATLVHRWMDE